MRNTDIPNKQITNKYHSRFQILSCSEFQMSGVHLGCKTYHQGHLTL